MCESLCACVVRERKIKILEHSDGKQRLDRMMLVAQSMEHECREFFSTWRFSKKKSIAPKVQAALYMP